jgi:hypothetical protein
MGMGVQVATFVFDGEAFRDTPKEVAESINDLIGADLQRAIRRGLLERGWSVSEAWPEDHGWDSEVSHVDEGKSLAITLVTSPELDGHTSEGRAIADRWRVVFSMNVGMFPKTKTRRLALLSRFATDLQAACEAAGAKNIVWEVGGPAPARAA